MVLLWDGPRLLLVLIVVTAIAVLVPGLRGVPHTLELAGDQLVERRGLATKRIELDEIRSTEVVPISHQYPSVWVKGPDIRVGPLSLGDGDHRRFVQALAREIHARGLAYLLKSDLARATFDPRRDPDQMPEGWTKW